MDLDPKPIAILLVKEGSRGDKLLFKYPYCTVYEDEYYFETNEALEGSKDEQETASNKIDAVAAREKEFSSENGKTGIPFSKDFFLLTKTSYHFLCELFNFVNCCTREDL